MTHDLMIWSAEQYLIAYLGEEDERIKDDGLRRIALEYVQSHGIYIYNIDEILKVWRENDHRVGSP